MYEPSALVSAELKRTPPREPDLMEPDYLDKYDMSTVFYDVFPQGTDLVTVGPPLENFASDIDFSAAHIAESPVQFVSTRLDRTEVGAFAGAPVRPDRVLTLPGIGDAPLNEVDYLKLLAGSRALITKSKNNRLEWIVDWAKYYVRVHDIDTVIVYDNGSDQYDCDQVLEALSTLNLAHVIVVNWPFRFGPQGRSAPGKNVLWDSDYCEYGIMEHARRRFLGSARMVINHDIDELLVMESELSLDELLDRSPDGVLSYQGIWVHSGGDLPAGSYSFTDIRMIDPTERPTTPKWVIDPGRVSDARQWKTHLIDGIDYEQTVSCGHRHFRQISTNWKFDRSKEHRRVRPLVRDRLLAGYLDYAYADAPTPYLQLLGAHLREGATAQERTAAIVDVVNMERFSRYNLTKHWFWTPTINVSDFSLANGVRVGIEIILVGTLLSSVCVARDDASWTILQHVGQATTKPISNRNHHRELGCWNALAPIETITTDLVFCISEVLSGLSAVPAQAVALLTERA
ncbi:glycosyltransferase family 92 protein [Brevibacterium sp. 91QC2O2]|uniref:glycosyltransferase family 92 protein n=1 Tax=Brevibacterium sp. 91QC2O2 TaxID=2968458 RepID=UPI00211BB7BF|nr:glycosyltransferase family 92 protein [Brevibacterium sp. 91QC2O2]